MHEHSDPVTEPVAELLAVARSLNHLPRHRVKLGSAQAGARRRERLLLRGAHQLIDLTRLPGDPLAGCIRARAVRAIAFVHRAPVDQQKHVRGDSLLARLGVWKRRVRAGGDDRREAGPLGTQAAHVQLDLERQLALAAPDRARFQHRQQRLVGELARAADALQLALVLHHAHVLDDAVACDQLPARRQQLAQARVVAHAEARLVEAEAPAPLLQRGGRPLEQVVGDDLPLEDLRQLLGGLCGIAEVSDEAMTASGRCARAVGRNQSEARGSREAREVAQVDRRAHEQHIEFASAQPSREQLQSLHALHAGARRWGRAHLPAASSRCSSSRTRASASR